MKTAVIIGAGYAGVRCALDLARSGGSDELQVVLVNKHNYHQFITQLHEPAAGGDYEDTRVPLDEIFAGTDVRLYKSTVTAIRPGEDKVLTEAGELVYDYLVVGLGSEPEYYGIPGLEENSLTLRSLNSAKVIRTQIENAFARYKVEPAEASLLTVVIGGAGFTGVELAGELADWLPDLTGRYDIDPDKVRIINIEAAPDILSGYEADLVKAAREVLTPKNVTFITGTAIKEVHRNEVLLTDGTIIRAATIVWTGGVKASRLVTGAGFKTTARGRAEVNEYLQAVDYPRVYITGDSAFIKNPETGEVMGPTAQVAIQSGHIAALNILADLRGQGKTVFHPRELGRVTSLGRKVAVGKVGARFKIKGRPAGLLKNLIKIKYLYSIGGIPRVLRHM